MDTENQIKDLPEPQLTSLSQSESTLRQWQLFVVFTQFVAFYACIHKIFIPLFLSFTSLNNSPYSELQFSIVLPLALVFFCRRSKSHTQMISFLCGVAILFGIDEIYATAMGRHSGWFAFSRLLSSIPMAIACGFAMSKSAFSPKFKTAWLGAGALLVAVLVNEYRLNYKAQVPSNIPAVVSESRQIPKNENVECGAQAVTVHKGVLQSSSNLVTLKDCGFSPSVQSINNGTVEISNETDHPVNLHLIIFENQKKKTLWNVLLRSREKRVFIDLELSAESIGLLYSDSTPEVGIVGLRPASLDRGWNLTRKPIGAQAIVEP